MGYYTTYELGVEEATYANLLEFENWLESGKDDFHYGRYSEIYRIESPRWKWYNHEEDMCDLSKRFPNIVLSLKGSGEQRYPYDDIWIKFFKNGKMQSCPIEVILKYGIYDESKLIKPAFE